MDSPRRIIYLKYALGTCRVSTITSTQVYRTKINIIIRRAKYKIIIRLSRSLAFRFSSFRGVSRIRHINNNNNDRKYEHASHIKLLFTLRSLLQYSRWTGSRFETRKRTPTSVLRYRHSIRTDESAGRAVGTMCARLTLTSRLIADQSRPVAYRS